MLLASWGALDVSFIWDDHHLVGEHSPVINAESPTGVFVAALSTSFWGLKDKHSITAYYRPLTVFSLAVDFWLWDGDPWGFHLTNLLLHLGVCGLVFALCRRLGASVLAATLGMVIFGTVPRLTETVTWISGRTDAIAALGGLGAVVLWCRARSGSADLGCRVGASAALLFGLLGKEVAVAAAVAIAAWEWARCGGGLRGVGGTARRLVPVAVVLALYVLGRFYAETPSYVSAPPLWPQRGWSVLEALGYYATMLATPWDAQLIIGTLGLTHPLRMVVGAVVGVGMLWCIGRLAARGFAPPRAVHVALAIAALLPVLHIIPLSHDVIASDRFLYLPLAALVPLAVAGVARCTATRPGLGRLAAVAASALVVFFGAATWQRNLLWQDELALWRETALHVGPANGLAEAELANLLGQRGRNEEAAAHYRRGIELMRQRIAIDPTFSLLENAVVNYGLVLSGLGRDGEALPVLESLVQRRPTVPAYRFYLAGALSRGLHFERADRQFAAALALYPDYSQAVQMRRQNRRAAALWRRLPEPEPEEPVEITAARAEVYFQVGRLERANALWLEVVRSPAATPEFLATAAERLEQQHRVVGETEGSLTLAAALARRGSRGGYRPKSSGERPR